MIGWLRARAATRATRRADAARAEDQAVDEFIQAMHATLPRDRHKPLRQMQRRASA